MIAPVRQKEAVGDPSGIVSFATTIVAPVTTCVVSESLLSDSSRSRSSLDTRAVFVIVRTLVPGLTTIVMRAVPSRLICPRRHVTIDPTREQRSLARGDRAHRHA